MTPAKIILVSALLIIAVNAGIRFLVINGQKSDIAVLQEKIAGARQPGEQNQGMPPSPVHHLEKDLQQIYAHIPDAASFTRYAVGLRTLIDQHQLSLEDSLVFLPADTTVPVLQQYNTRLRIHGSYPKIKQFISGMMNLPGLLLFNAMRFEKDPEHRDIVKANMDLSIFFTQGRRHDDH